MRHYFSLWGIRWGRTSKSQSPIDRYKSNLCVKLYLVDSPEGGHIHSLPPDGTCTTNTGGVLTGPAVDDGIDQDLEGILATKGNLSHDNTCESQIKPPPPPQKIYYM